MININNISLSFDDKQIFADFSLVLPSKGIVCLFGPSGCGKTTLFNILAGLISPDNGNITGLENKTFSYVFQSPRLLPWLSVIDNISLVKNNSRTNAERLLKFLDMQNETNAMPNELSGGMKQRVSIARALNYDGDILLLDEPMNGLDAALAEKLWQLIVKQYKDRLVLFITHNKQEAQKYSERIIEMYPLET